MIDGAAEEAMAIIDREEFRVQQSIKLTLCEERNANQAATINEQREEITRLTARIREAEGLVYSLNQQAIRHRAERKAARGSQDLH